MVFDSDEIVRPVLDLELTVNVSDLGRLRPFQEPIGHLVGHGHGREFATLLDSFRLGEPDRPGWANMSEVFIEWGRKSDRD